MENSNNKQEQNVFITALSNLDRRFQYYGYKMEKEIYLGGFSGEPGIRFAIRELAKEGKLFDRFVLLCSKETMSRINVTEILNKNDKAITNDVRNGIKAFLGTVPGDTADTDGNDSDLADLNDISAFDYILKVIKDEVKRAGFTDIDIDKYVKNTCLLNDDNDGPLIISDNPDIPQLKKNIERHFDYGKTTNLYVDITGGTRITSIVALLIARWYEQRGKGSPVNAKVKKVIYSSIMDDPKVIIDWTDNYELFKIADSKTKIDSLPFFTSDLFNSDQFDEEFQVRFDRYLRETVNTEGMEKEEIDIRVRFLTEAMDRLQVVNSMENLELIEKIQNAVNIYSSTVVDRLYEQSKDTESWDEDKKKKFITDWYSNIINDINSYVNINLRNKPIRTNLVKLIQTNQYYYERYDKNDAGKLADGVILKVINMLNDLRDSNEEPARLWESYQSIDSDKYDEWKDTTEYFSDKGAGKFYNEIFTKRLVIKEFQSDIFNNKIRHYGRIDSIIPVNMEMGDYDKLYKYEKLRNLYYNYGFPFACIDSKNQLLDNIQIYYQEKVSDLFMELEDKWRGRDNSDEYRFMIEDLLGDQSGKQERLEKLIPIYDIFKMTELKPGIFSDIAEAKKCFKDFSELYEKVRPVRNAIAHPEAEKLKKFRTPEAVQEARVKIRVWLDEYKSLKKVERDDIVR